MNVKALLFIYFSSMFTRIKISVTAIFILLLIVACNSSNTENKISDDALVINKGDSLFKQYCSGCHNFKQDGIGPQLSGITTAQTKNQLAAFIKNPNNIIQSGDVHAQQLYQHYKTLMPSFSLLRDDDINAIIAFINTHKSKTKITDTDTANAIADPIPAKIQFGGTVVQLQKIIQIPASSDSGKKPLARITKLSVQPGTGKLFVVDLRGKLYSIEDGKAVVYLDMQKLRPHFINEPGLATGFGSFAFDPDFHTNGIFYTTHAEAAGFAKADFALPDSIKPALQWVLTEWKADDPNANVFKGTSRELLRVEMVSGIHGMQEIAFNPLAKRGDDDYGDLYIDVGDGGAVENGYPFLAHNKEKIWGTILRIDPRGNNSASGKYGIPKTNPFIKNDSALKEIFAYGFRNPHRISWTHTGQMIACNIGQSKIESVDYIFPGHDYGWPIREGNFMLHPNGDIGKVYPLPANDSSYHVTYPVAMFDHDEGKAICGGFEYTGDAIPSLKNKFLFGDIYSGRLFYINMADIKPGKFATVHEWKVSINGKQESLQKICNDDRVDLHFGKDDKGNIYILTKADGNIYELMNL